MADYIGRIQVPPIVQSGQVFPNVLMTDYGYGMTQDWKIIEHRFGDLATLGFQRYAIGSGARKFQFSKSVLSFCDRQPLIDFYESVQGSYQSFTYAVPSEGSFTNYQVVFDSQPLSISDFLTAAQTGLTFLEIVNPANAPLLNISGGPQTRFPSDAVAQALATDVQVIIPLVHIRTRAGASAPAWDPGTTYTAGQLVNYNSMPYVATATSTGSQPGASQFWRTYDILLSDRRCNVNGFPGYPMTTTFLPRLLSVGIPGTGNVILSQSIDGRADNVEFIFGNADRTMSKLVNDCSLEFAEIDLSIFHVQTNTLLQLWKGLILSWQIDGSAQMTVSCSDGLYPVTLAYPPRNVTRQCWKPFNQDVVPGYRPCPYSTQGSGGDPTSCDYFYNSTNGCLSHGMSNYFGGHPEQPQSVVIKDDGTGVVGGFFRHTVTSTSILSDSIWGSPLPEIWCNSFGNPQRALWANCLVAAVRDESTYEDVLGIVGAGPLGSFEGMSIQTNADGYKFAVAPTADGFFPQGFRVDGALNIQVQTILGIVIPGLENYGLRQSLGNDPAYLGKSPQEGIDAFSLGQGTPQVWDEYDPNFSNDGKPNSIIPYAAGTALCEIRYPKSAGTGITPTTAESHNMQVPIRMGLAGTVFDPDGNGTATSGIVNPFWVAANSYFRALGIQHADFATQLSYISLPSITNAAGMGCADIAALWVTPLVGTTIPSFEVTAEGEALIAYNLDYYNNTFTYADAYQNIITMSLSAAESAGYIIQGSTDAQEPQFMFQGTVAEFKPFRDWLTAILNCTLGWFCFEFGKLSMGIRYSAVPTDSFTLGSMLFQSLTITPISAAFEYLRIEFANVELQFQEDYAEYQDKDHAAYYGRAGVPLPSSMRSPGCSTLSQGLRIATSRTREEIGGIYRDDLIAAGAPTIEWDNNKRISFKSTLLALTCGVGDVIAVQHPELPTYPGAHPDSRSGSNGPFPPNTWPFRIEKYLIHSDWSVSIQARSCVDSMYYTEVGPQPTGVQPRPMPIMFYPEPLGQWAPYQVQAPPNDALFPNEWTFNLQQTFSYLGHGSLLTSAVVAGCLPVNQFIPNCGAVEVKKGSVSWSATAAGGQIPGGTTLYLQICAAIVDTTPAIPVVTSYSPPSAILIMQIPTGSDTNSVTISDIQWPPVSGLNGWVLFANTIEDLICGQMAGLGQPASITFPGPVARQTYAVPDYDVNILRLRAQVLIHGGVIGASVDSLASSPPTITSSATVDLTRKDDWAGRVLAIIGRQQGDGIAPWQHFGIVEFQAQLGRFTLDRDPVAAGVQTGDVFTVCTLGIDNSANPYVVTEPGMSNASTGHQGETPNDPNRIGRMIRVIKGTSRGLSAKIVANTAITYTLDRPLPIDATSVWILVDPGWNYLKDVVVNNADPSKTTQSAIEINNYAGLALMVEGVNIDSEGVIVDDSDAPIRMLFIPGVQGTTSVAT